MSATLGSEGEAMALFSAFFALFLSLPFVSGTHFLSKIVLTYQTKRIPGGSRDYQ